MEKPILTISLLSSGRINKIERCLSSLSLIRDKIPTEVIVVDTDPNHREDVHQILEKYADKIIPFEWCDNFSAARNAGVHAASGEWFLYVDDDEWFIDAEPIVDFLTSDKSKKAIFANIRIQNYKNKSFTLSEFAWVSRMFRLGVGIEFHGHIHELFGPVSGDETNLPTILGHDGYVYATNAEGLNHAKRNLALLEKAMKEDPRQIRWVLHCMVEYENLQNFDKSLELAQKGYNMLKDQKDYRSICIRGAFAVNHLRILSTQSKWEECCRVYDKLMKFKDMHDVAKAGMEMYVGVAYYNLQKVKEASEHLGTYMKYYDQLHDREVTNTLEYVSVLCDTFHEITADVIRALYISANILQGNTEPFEKYFTQIKWGNSGGYDTSRCPRPLFYATMHEGYNKYLIQVVEEFWKYNDTRSMIEQYISEHTNSGIQDDDSKLWNLLHAINDADLKENIPWGFKILWVDHNYNNESSPKRQLNKYFKETIKSVNPLLLNITLWNIGIKHGVNLKKYIDEIPMEKWSGCIEVANKFIDAFFAFNLYTTLLSICGEEDEHFKSFVNGSADLIATGKSLELQRKILAGETI